MQSHFATKSRNWHLNRGANGDAVGSPFKCKVPFGKARGPTLAPNRRTSHIRGRSGLAVCSNVWDKGTCPVTKMGRHLLRDLTANDSSKPLFKSSIGRDWHSHPVFVIRSKWSLSCQGEPFDPFFG